MCPFCVAKLVSSIFYIGKDVLKIHANSHSTKLRYLFLEDFFFDCFLHFNNITKPNVNMSEDFVKGVLYFRKIAKLLLLIKFIIPKHFSFYQIRLRFKNFLNFKHKEHNKDTKNKIMCITNT